MSRESFRCFMVRKSGNETIETGIETRPVRDLPPGDVLIDVRFSSLNYKDALVTTGHPGLTRKFPHVPGIDAAGVVLESSDPRVVPGAHVLVTGYDLGVGCWGGWGELICVPGDWVVPLPEPLSMEQAMTLGTAGFTAGKCVTALIRNEVVPDDGDIVVTGATGGVGSLAICILAKAGFRVVAVTGKSEKAEWLKQLGASEIIGRADVLDPSHRPLLRSRWAGAVDTVGGETLAALVRSTRQGGCVAACGLVGGVDLSLTVHPFILRGVTLAGVDSALTGMARRREIWDKLAHEWRPDQLDDIIERVSLDQIGGKAHEMLAGTTFGRIVLQHEGG